MKIFLDHQIVRMLIDDGSKIMVNPLFCETGSQLHFGWPSLLEYLELGSLFSNLPAFDQTNPVFVACISTLFTYEDKEVLFYLFDRLFTENLSQIKDLPQVNASFLLGAIREKYEKPFFSEVEKVLSPTLLATEEALREKTSPTLHDLILYLAWDRMCVCVGGLFNYQSTDPKFIRGIDVLKECLIESFQHITQEGRTSPSLYRMLESLFFYHMREENLHKHTEEEWLILSQSFPALKAQEDLVDFFYIDNALISEREQEVTEESSEYYLTLDSPSKVYARLAFAQCMMNKLKAEVPLWRYTLSLKKIIHLDTA